MAQGVNIFDKYGIKEVANVYFEALEDDLAAGVYKGDIVLYLDSLKVSTIETTAENVAAQGGWGNPRLVQWDYGKEINLTLEDALISLESLRFMLGGAIHRPSTTEKVLVHHTEEVVVTSAGVVPAPKNKDGITLLPAATANHPIRLMNLGSNSKIKGYRTQIQYAAEGTNAFTANGAKITFTNPAAGVSAEAVEVGDHIRIFWVEEVDSTSTTSAVEVTISPDTFPGTYKVIGDTFMRAEKTGKDEMFQFVIGKAKVTSDVTITLEAEGDPSTFEMTLNVLRDTNERGATEMMKLIRYSVAQPDSVNSGNDNGSLTQAGS